MHRYILYICVILATFTTMPLEAEEDHKQSLPFKIDHIEKLTSARYVGPGVIREDTNAAPKTLSKRSVETTVDASQCTQTYGCLNCTWSRVCAPTSEDTLVEVNRSACPSTRPFCDPKTGSCVAQASSLCMTPSNITCFKNDDYFPHPSDCKKFVYCHNYTSFLFECGGTTYYNPSTKRCDYYSCYTANCAGNDGMKVQHPLSNLYFTFCAGGTAVGFDSCIGNDYLNATSQLCEPNCSYEGLIMDTTNCTRYYKCHFEWVSNYRFMVRTRLDCPTGCSFDSDEFQCVEGVPEKGCIRSY